MPLCQAELDHVRVDRVQTQMVDQQIGRRVPLSSSNGRSAQSTLAVYPRQVRERVGGDTSAETVSMSLSPSETALI